MTKYHSGSIFDYKLIVNIPNSVSSVKPSDDDIDNFKIMIAPYLRKFRKVIEGQIKEMYEPVVAYFNYLSTCTNRDEEQEELWREMVNFLNGEPEHLPKVETQSNVEDFEYADIE